MSTHQSPTKSDMLHKLANLMGTKVQNHRLEIPAQFGKGYCCGYEFNPYIRLMIFNYELHENLLIENPELEAPRQRILFKFQHILPPPTSTIVATSTQAIPLVLIASGSMNTDAVIPIHTHPSTLNIEVNADYLSGLFNTTPQSPVLQSLLQNTQPLLFEQRMHPRLQHLIDEITSEPVEEIFECLYRRIKAEELVCRLLMELEKRSEKQLYALNAQDIRTLYQVKTHLLTHLETPPVIQELALSAHMSPTKLKRLFRQIFGHSIFSYYQLFRMKEAARRLEEEKQTVSDVGYQMGFTNLSHFSRVFEAHIGMKPKKYSLFRTNS